MLLDHVWKLSSESKSQAQAWAEERAYCTELIDFSTMLKALLLVYTHNSVARVSCRGYTAGVTLSRLPDQVT